MTLMVAKTNRFEIEGRWCDAMIGSCDLPDSVGLCLMITEIGREVVDICQVDAPKQSFFEHTGKQVPVAVMQRTLEIFEERVRIK